MGKTFQGFSCTKISFPLKYTHSCRKTPCVMTSLLIGDPFQEVAQMLNFGFSLRKNANLCMKYGSVIASYDT